MVVKGVLGSLHPWRHEYLRQEVVMQQPLLSVYDNLLYKACMSQRMDQSLPPKLQPSSQIKKTDMRFQRGLTPQKSGNEFRTISSPVVWAVLVELWH